MDKYQKKAQEIIDESDGTWGASLELSIAVALRECAASVYETVARDTESVPDIDPEEAVVEYRARAALLRGLR